MLAAMKLIALLGTAGLFLACTQGHAPAINDPSKPSDTGHQRAPEAPGDDMITWAQAQANGDGGPRFASPNLPAVSRDGKRVAIAQRLEDGARGTPNQTLWIKDADTDEVLTEMVVLGVKEHNDLVGSADEAAALAALIEKRLAKANALLATETWTPFTAGAAPSGEWNAPRRVDFGGITVVYEQPALTVTENGVTIHDADYPAWLSRPYKVMDDEIECENPALLRAVYLSREQRVLVVRIGYYGTDMCWEPDSQFHVVRLPR